jgi:hypothetical protein
MGRRARPLPAGVKQLRARIERWRTTRERRTAMPSELWSEAADLARVHGAYPVARGLRISFEGLKRRLAESTEDSQAIAARPRAFVEMSGAELLGGPVVPGTVLELCDASGTRLLIHLARVMEVDVASLVGAAFRQRRA